MSVHTNAQIKSLSVLNITYLFGWLPALHHTTFLGINRLHAG